MTLCLIDICLADASETLAVVEFNWELDPATTILRGEIRGPRSRYARTLPASFAFDLDNDCSDFGATRTVKYVGRVTDPCYWTPTLPFLYDVQIEWHNKDGERCQARQSFGLKRLAARGRSLYLDSRRIVLRGGFVDAPADSLVTKAKEAETSLAVHEPEVSLIDAADESGVWLIADLRGRCQTSIDLARLTLRPSVAIIVLDHDSSPPVSWRGFGRPLLATVIDPDCQPSTLEASCRSCDLFLVELKDEERPPKRLVDVEHPIIAVRRGSVAADFQGVRGECDRLQAELAPELDLAGYFAGK